jgi:signal transduction histidine kinase
MPDGRWVLVKVMDSGPGIPVEESEHVFEKFRQVKDNKPERGSKGTGLGLTFVKEVIELQGGKAWVETECDLDGACFAFTLPVRPEGDHENNDMSSFLSS